MRQGDRVAVVRSNVRDSVIRQFQGQTMGPAAELLNADEDAFLNELSTFNTVSDLQDSLLADYNDELKAYAIRRKETSDRRDQVADIEAELKDEKETVDAKLAEAEDLLDELEAEEREAILSRDSDVRVAPAYRPTGRAAAAVQYAMAQVGDAYVYGAAGPAAFDCSGLTMMAWAQAGVSLPHSSSAQYGMGPHISESQLQPGDLVFYYSPISHVAMYIGNGMIVHAANPGAGVLVAICTPCRTSARSALADRWRLSGAPAGEPCSPSACSPAARPTSRTSHRRRRRPPTPSSRPRRRPRSTGSSAPCGAATPTQRPTLGADDEAGSQLRSIARTASALDLSDVTFSYVAENGQISPDGTWTAAVTATWRITGFESTPARADVEFAFADGGESHRRDRRRRRQQPGLAQRRGDGPPYRRRRRAGGRRRPAGPAARGRGGASAGRRPAGARQPCRPPGGRGPGIRRRPARRPRAAARDVRRRGRGHDVGRRRQRAGHADPHLHQSRRLRRTRAAGGPGRDQPRGRARRDRRAPESGAEAWLLEGFADYVALRDVDLPLSRTAGQIIAQVRNDGVPAQLPSRVDLDSQARPARRRLRVGVAGVRDTGGARRGGGPGGALRRGCSTAPTSRTSCDRSSAGRSPTSPGRGRRSSDARGPRA